MCSQWRTLPGDVEQNLCASSTRNRARGEDADQEALRRLSSRRFLRQPPGRGHDRPWSAAAAASWPPCRPLGRPVAVFRAWPAPPRPAPARPVPPRPCWRGRLLARPVPEPSDRGSLAGASGSCRFRRCPRWPRPRARPGPAWRGGAFRRPRAGCRAGCRGAPRWSRSPRARAYPGPARR